MSPHLCLGTAQFGLPYGVTNPAGIVSERDVRSILTIASNTDVQWLDTAQAYGSSEEVFDDPKHAYTKELLAASIA